MPNAKSGLKRNLSLPKQKPSAFYSNAESLSVNPSTIPAIKGGACVKAKSQSQQPKRILKLRPKKFL